MTLTQELHKVSCRMEDGIILLKVATANRDAIDHILNELAQIFYLHDIDEPFLIFSDYTEGVFSPYIAQKIKLAYERIPPQLWGRSAILLPTSAWGRTFQMIANRHIKRYLPRLERRFFLDRQAGMEWLREDLV